MARLVEEVTIVRKSQPRINLIIERAAALITAAPQFAYASVIAQLSSWAPSSVQKAAEDRGVTLATSTRANRASLPAIIQNLFLDGNVSDEDLLEIRHLALGVVSSVSEEIYVEDGDETDPLV